MVYEAILYEFVSNYGNSAILKLFMKTLAVKYGIGIGFSPTAVFFFFFECCRGDHHRCDVEGGTVE